MISKPDKNKIRQKRHRRVRGKLSGTADRPRLNVFRSNTGIYAQVIDDVAGVTRFIFPTKKAYIISNICSPGFI